MQAFCSTRNIPYNAFEKYLKMRRYFSTAHKIQITGVPELENEGKEASASADDQLSTCEAFAHNEASVRIMIDIRMTNGINIRQKNLNYEGLRALVEKLEVLC